ncbi:solute carrier family 23 member 2-like [Ruditapes philippinarum]|uniref:solute carrier family 23 member 2-like n=1 Tax=Ruditapes philippinarum TaxID=129788 RepID=UPI00295B85DC|nr:solute carrier family 23 member 2-like [Ruditapes philippinarum]
MELKEVDGEEQLRNENAKEKWTKLGETGNNCNNWIDKSKSDFDKVEKVKDETLDHGIDEGKDTSDGKELEQEVGDAIEGEGEKNEKEGLRKKKNEFKAETGCLWGFWTILFVSGLATLLQSTLGVRLPIVQGGTVTFVIPTIAILLQPQWECEFVTARNQYGPNLNLTQLGLPEIGSEKHREMWMLRIREIQGAIIVASLFQVLTGVSGILMYMLKYIGPLCIVPIITLTGISLFPAGSKMASGHWWIALLTMFLITIFSQYMKRVEIPCFCTKDKIAFFSLFPVLLGVMTSFIVCIILTATDVLPADKTKWGYMARTDTGMHVLTEAKWFRFPYPGQWGLPKVSMVGVFGMLAGVIAAMIESIGDYYACARLAGAPPPPLHAVNRGVFTEGVACVLAGIWGSGNGTTSYAENIGVIGITKVGSRRVVQIGGLMMLVLGCFGKFAALFTLIPTPVIGGMFMITFGMVTAVGLSNLQYIDLNSPRNLFILGVSLFFGLSLPMWITEHDVIDTGNDIIDQLLSVLLSTSMFVGGLIGFVLDNTIPGTDEERGINSWRQTSSSVKSGSSQSNYDLYNFPYIQPYLDKIKLFNYVPVCPRFLAKPVIVNSFSNEAME